ncbi:MAG TPA: acetyl-CoA carboxylase biotin carboxylase subunit [Terriglobia bacterium]|nr:acetyl-CoA carboxylase biotin carboxylase subunit [Terriglobia bacterium]
MTEAGGAPVFRKVLIANRGEIAVRVMRACREMGIATVAVYSDADRNALHVRYADEAYPIGPAPSAESYLRMDRILDVARRSHSEAIHPGYGFLSENAAFAPACEAAGIVFVGPPASAMKLMGSKTTARHAAIQAGLPVVPGTDHDLKSLEEIRHVAQEIGFPVMLKAAAGGGGKGMRLVDSADQLEAAWRNARSEAQNAFGDAAVYLEKYIERPRHVEIQILGDRHGDVIYLGERECSLQRRHQKVLEECPSPLLDEPLRRRMGETAVRIGKIAGYVNAGTVEFLVDGGRNFYFLEMNTRLQVEHPVTELVTGIDLVKEQLRIAAGRRLGWRQEDVHLRGAAIECRIYAEDPANNFFPSPGRITALRVPSGPGVRNDSGVYEGWTVPLEYDPLLSKLVAWGSDRSEAVARIERALGEYEIAGIQTNIPFFRRLLRHPDFIAGRLDTGLIERALAAGLLESESAEGAADAALPVVAMLVAGLRSSLEGSRQPARLPHASAWKAAGCEAALNNWPSTGAASWSRAASGFGMRSDET